MNELISVLHDIRPLTVLLRTALQETIQYREVPAKQRLTAVRSNRLTLVQSGLVRMFYEEGDHEWTVAFFKEGQVFLQVITGAQEPKKLLLQPLERTTLQYLEGRDIVSLDADYHFGEYVQVLMSRYFEQVQQQTHLLNMDPAIERYRHLLKHQPELIQRVPTKYLASYMGVSRETLSRIRNRIIR